MTYFFSVFLRRLSCFVDCGAGVCFSCVKDSGILRDKMKYKGNQNCGTKSSTKNRFGSVSKHYTDITWKDRGKSGDTSELCNCK
jgi:hypothetical protein